MAVCTPTPAAKRKLLKTYPLSSMAATTRLHKKNGTGTERVMASSTAANPKREAASRTQARVAPLHGNISRWSERAPEASARADTSSRNNASKPWYR